jgi:hypothetical protein
MNAKFSKISKLFSNLKLVYVIIIILIILSPLFVYLYLNYIKDPELGSTRYIQNFVERDNVMTEDKRPEEIVRTVLAGKSLREDAPAEYKSDDATFKSISKIRNNLAGYYERYKSFPKSLDETGENGTYLVNRGIIYKRDNDSYQLLVKFLTEEAVLVGANIKYSNQNSYSLGDKTVTFTNLSGNFFNFTGSTIK